LLSIFNRNFTYEDFKKKFGHNLDKMTKELQKFIPDFMKNMSDKIKELFNQLLKLKFDSLRYLDEEINLNINFLDLKKLITYVNDILEKYRNENLDIKEINENQINIYFMFGNKEINNLEKIDLGQINLIIKK